MSFRRCQIITCPTRRILGIDPGSRITGFGIIEQLQGMPPTCLFGGCVRLTAKDMPTRLGKLFGEIQEIVKQFKPTELAIEQVFIHKNARSALQLGQARGVAIAGVMVRHLPVYEYAPRQIKLAIVGRGAAEKTQVQHMIKILLGLSSKPQADAADALAVAMCHLHHVSKPSLGPILDRKRQKRSTQWKNYDRTTSRDDH